MKMMSDIKYAVVMTNIQSFRTKTSEEHPKVNRPCHDHQLPGESLIR